MSSKQILKMGFIDTLTSKNRSVYSRSIFKKIYKVSIPIAAVLAFFLVYNACLADRSIINLRIILDKLVDIKKPKEISSLEPLLDGLICIELSRKDIDPVALEILELSKHVISRIKSKEQLKDLKFFFTELIKKKKNERNAFLYNLDIISSVIEPIGKQIQTLALRLRAGKLSKKITLISNPDEAQRIYFALGSISTNLKEFNLAQEYFIKVWELGPDNLLAMRARFKLACIYGLQKKIDSAKSILDRLIQDYPGTQIVLDSKRELANMWQQSGGFDKTIEIDQSLTLEYQQSPITSLVWFKIGYIYIYDLKDYQKFLQIFNDKIKDEHPKSPWAKYIESNIIKRVAKRYRNMGFIFLLKHRYQEALDYFSFALQIFPDDGSCYAGQGLAYFWLGQKAKALEMAKKGRQLSPQDALTVVNLGFIYINMGMFDDAISEYKNFISTKPFSKEAHYNLGYIYVIINDIDKAINEFRKATDIDPKFSASYNNIGYLFWQKEEYAEAMEEFRKAIRANPTCLEAHFNLGYSFRMLGKLSEAKAEFENVLRIDPGRPEAVQNLREINEALSIH